MKKWLMRLGFFAALAFLVLTVINASWLADVPRGKVKLIAHRGIAQVFDSTGVKRDTCTATRIETPYHPYIENTALSAKRAGELGASMIEVDIAPTKDGALVAFHDWTLDCRTDGSGPVREATLEELTALDAAYGYTADGGKTFPLRGKGHTIQPLDRWMRSIPFRAEVMFNFKSGDPREADMLAAALNEFGRDPEEEGDAFYGHPAPVARIRELYPQAWAWSTEAAKQCSSDYVLTGWTGLIPDSCEGGTMIIPINRQWMFWGWPNKLIERMESVGARIIVTGDHANGEPNTGLTLPEQLGDIPRSFNGYVWVEDIWTIGPALYPDKDTRREFQVEDATEALARRRAK